jgi:hypothetical protein
VRPLFFFLPGDLPPVLPRVDRLVPQLLLNTQQLVVLGEALRAAGRAGLDLARGQADGQVRDERVLREVISLS